LLKVDTWWKKALDGNILGRIVKEDTVHKGLQIQRRKKKKKACNSFNKYDSALHCAARDEHRLYGLTRTLYRVSRGLCESL
jgi:hypothetical protein